MAESSLPDQVTESVASSNFKNLAEGAAFYSNLAMGDAVSHQRSVNALREGYLGQALNRMGSVDPTEAVSQLKQLTGNDVGQQIAALAAAVASIQANIKGAQTTPPQTGS